MSKFQTPTASRLAHSPCSAGRWKSGGPDGTSLRFPRGESQLPVSPIGSRDITPARLGTESQMQTGLPGSAPSTACSAFAAKRESVHGYVCVISAASLEGLSACERGQDAGRGDTAERQEAASVCQAGSHENRMRNREQRGGPGFRPRPHCTG